MLRPRSAVPAVLTAVSLLATTPAGASTAGWIESAQAPVPPPPAGGSVSPLPDLTSASPLDVGHATAPRSAQPLAPERGSARLGASAVTVTPPLAFTFKANAYAVNDVPRENYPYRRTSAVPLVDTGVHDAYGVRMFKIGTKLYDHPVAQAQYGIDNLESYLLTSDVTYLDRAKAQAARLMLRARKVGDAWYIPYPFDFTLHGIASERLTAPWYSAMAQGQAMTLFVRLFEVTQNSTYQNAAAGVFASFLRSRTMGTPWTVWVDSVNHLWLEEYPAATPDRTFNGHLFATFGLWDYWRITKDDRAVTLIRGALTTVADNSTAWRRLNWLSKYCLSHPSVQSEKYHLIHINQLFKMYGITRNSGFVRYAENLSYDYPPPVVTGTVRLSAGNITGVTFTSTGTVVSRKTISLSRPSTAPADRRQRILGQPGLWHRITKGSLAGYFVQAKPGIVVLLGQHVTYDYYPARRVTLAAGKAATGYTFDTAGTVVTKQTVVPTVLTAFGATKTAVWNGVEYLLAGTGPLAGMWIRRSALGV